MTRAQFKVMEELVRQAERQGCQATLARGGHWKIYTPKGMVVVPATPSDRRAVLNSRAELRRHGVPL